MRITNTTLITPNGLTETTTVHVDSAGKIECIGSHPSTDDAPDFDANGAVLMPGFIDLHMHGALGGDLLELDPQHWSHVCDFLARQGVTGFLATACSTPIDTVDKFLELVAHFQRGPSAGSQVLGVHLEGPFLNPAYCGMQPESTLLLPSEHVESVERWLSTGLVRRMTVALELDGGLDLLERCQRDGVVVSLGHTACLAEDVAGWSRHGLCHTTHLYNAMSRAEKRGGAVRVCGCVEGTLGTPGVIAEIIGDGFHCPEFLFRTAFQAKGPHGITIATDSTPLTGLSLVEGQECQYGGRGEGMPVCVGVMRDGMMVSPDTGALVGAVTPLGQMFPRILKWLDEDWYAAMRLFSTNAAELIGLGGSKGLVEVGYDADLVLVDRESMLPIATWIGGLIVQ